LIGVNKLSSDYSSMGSGNQALKSDSKLVQRTGNEHGDLDLNRSLAEQEGFNNTSEKPIDREDEPNHYNNAYGSDIDHMNANANKMNLTATNSEGDHSSVFVLVKSDDYESMCTQDNKTLTSAASDRTFRTDRYVQDNIIGPEIMGLK